MLTFPVDGWKTWYHLIIDLIFTSVLWMQPRFVCMFESHQCSLSCELAALAVCLFSYWSCRFVASLSDKKNWPSVIVLQNLYSTWAHFSAANWLSPQPSLHSGLSELQRRSCHPCLPGSSSTPQPAGGYFPFGAQLPSAPNPCESTTRGHERCATYRGQWPSGRT
jgi:hypothetical protein